MNLSKEKVKAAVLAKGYKWFTDRPNLIGIRSKLNVPNVFNDILCVITEKHEKYYTITTDPGTTYLVKPINAKGCFVLKPGQYIDVWAIGFHQGKADHRAMRQVGTFTGYRDNDHDAIAEAIGEEDTGNNFGVNCHGADKKVELTKIGPWSAGCQVHSRWSNKEEMMDICEEYRAITHNRFTYTLLEEADIAA